jgi:hypothetical protein
MINGYLEKVEALGPHIVRAGERADAHACRVVELLEEIRDATATGYEVDAYEYPQLPFTAAGTKTIESRQGFVRIIKNIAVIGAAAVNVDLFIGDSNPGGFAWREPLGAAGSSSRQLIIPTVEASPIYVQASAACQVNLIIQRIEL